MTEEITGEKLYALMEEISKPRDSYYIIPCECARWAKAQGMPLKTGYDGEAALRAWIERNNE